ncbi:MAG: RNA 2'-phosphotransferase [Actinomycetota bacterium]|nr:RNA 2'-phosphotransferase [Actinomycetota bacterium]
MDPRRRARLSKLLALLLRHDPQRAGLRLEPGGWVSVEHLIAALGRLGRNVTKAELEEVVRVADGAGGRGGKDRFELSADGTHVRARYGHSLAVDMGYEPAEPPPVLYHGTATTALDVILTDGIRSMGRQLVHLSEDVPSAAQVGARHGRPVVVAVDAAALARDGGVFHRLPGGVWLTAEVPPHRIEGVVTP